MAEPVKPVTTGTPNAAAARAVSFIRSAARVRTPSGSPSPQTSGGRTPLWRASIGIAHGLAHEVVADRPAPEAVALEQLAPAGGVIGLGHRAVDLEVVAPARELEAVEAERRRLAREVVECQVGPLAGEQRDRSGHLSSGVGGSRRAL